ncbi:immune-induced peptide 18 [Drosophila eugracilis]|uniref:immune-induced peptide 18 n=1 Tax=Drosophila eugracilis TaxID=29029 RepID=UPI0007E7D7D1|nr:immune-induced peptide 18 [Drosophila eugracilis]
MKLFALCCLLFLGLLSCLPTSTVALPSRHTGPGSGSSYGSGNPFRNLGPAQRPIIYDSPVGKPSNTMYA